MSGSCDEDEAKRIQGKYFNFSTSLMPETQSYDMHFHGIFSHSFAYNKCEAKNINVIMYFVYNFILSFELLCILQYVQILAFTIIQKFNTSNKKNLYTPTILTTKQLCRFCKQASLHFVAFGWYETKLQYMNQENIRQNNELSLKVFRLRN